MGIYHISFCPILNLKTQILVLTDTCEVVHSEGLE